MFQAASRTLDGRTCTPRPMLASQILEPYPTAEPTLRDTVASAPSWQYLDEGPECADSV